MLFTQHVIDSKRTASSSTLFSGPYPIGMSLDKFLDLFADVKSLEGQAYSIIDATINQNFVASDIVGTLSNLNSFGNSSSDFSSFDGFSRRVITPIGQLLSNGAEPNLSATPTSLVNFPVHLIGDAGGFARINFGKTLMNAGLFYPHIEIKFSTGMGNLVGGNAVGYIDFDGFGAIPIYGGPDSNPLNLNLVGGSISISERYSSLRASALSAQEGESLTFSSSPSLRHLSSYQTAFFGHVETREITSSDGQLIVKVPTNAKSGPIRFASDDPHFDEFLSYDEILIT